MIEFKSLGWTTINGRGDVAIVACDRERPREDCGLVGEAVKIDGYTYVVKGVERRLPASPIRRGEIIGLLVSWRPS